MNAQNGVVKTGGNFNQIKSLLQQQQQQQLQPTPKNEKEIQIQRISSNQTIEQAQQNGIKSKLIDNEPASLKVSLNNDPISNINNNNNVSSNSGIVPVNQQLNNKNTSLNTNTSVATSPQTPQINDTKSKLNKYVNRPLQRSQQSHIHVPQFHFPHGRLEDRQFKTIDDLETMKLISVEFKQSKDGKIFREDFGEVVKLLGLPIYWKNLLFRTCTLNSKINYVTYPILEQVWSK